MYIRKAIKYPKSLKYRHEQMEICTIFMDRKTQHTHVSFSKLLNKFNAIPIKNMIDLAFVCKKFKKFKKFRSLDI